MDILIMTVLALAFGLSLGYAAIRFRVEGDPLIDKIDAVLPQTQCGQCGYPGCKPYATALAEGNAEINQCPPGGEVGMRVLADLLGRDPIPLFGMDGKASEPLPMVAVIDESICIGCTKCIQACPVDAIIGAPKHKHTVLEEFCTGCELCLPPICPVPDCLTLREVKPTIRRWKWISPEEQPRRQTA